MINSFVERTFVGKTCNHRHVVCTIHVFVNHNPTLKKNNHVSENRGYVYPKNVDIKNDDQPKQSIVFFPHCFHMANPPKWHLFALTGRAKTRQVKWLQVVSEPEVSLGAAAADGHRIASAG